MTLQEWTRLCCWHETNFLFVTFKKKSENPLKANFCLLKNCENFNDLWKLFPNSVNDVHLFVPMDEKSMCRRQRASRDWYIIDFGAVYKRRVRDHVNERLPRANTIRIPEFHTLSTINHGIGDTQKADWMRNDPPASGRGSLLFYILPLPPDWTDLPFQLLEVGAVSLWISVTIGGENVWADRPPTLISWERFSSGGRLHYFVREQQETELELASLKQGSLQRKITVLEMTNFCGILQLQLKFVPKPRYPSLSQHRSDFYQNSYKTNLNESNLITQK